MEIAGLPLEIVSGCAARFFVDGVPNANATQSEWNKEVLMKKVVLIVVAMMFAGVVYGHLPYMEEADFSFDAPFVITPAQDGGPPAVMRSMAIFSFLDNNDYDVYQFTLTPGDFYKPVLDELGRPVFENGQMVMQFSPVIVSASALPPACQQ